MGCGDGYLAVVDYESICFEDGCTIAYRYECVDVEDTTFSTTSEPGVDCEAMGNGGGTATRPARFITDALVAVIGIFVLA